MAAFLRWRSSATDAIELSLLASNFGVAMTCPSIVALAVAMTNAPDPAQQSFETENSTSTALPSQPLATRREPMLEPAAKLRIWLWLALVVACLPIGLCGQALVAWIEDAFGLRAPDVRTMLSGGMFAALLVIYIVLLALPFVPGAEIGIILLMLFGAEAAAPVYGATVAALLISFLAGRLIPLPRLIAGLKCMGLARAAHVLASGSLPLQQAQEVVAGPSRVSAVLAGHMQHRCIALGVLLNTPGNSVLGGGGGIALAIGASRLLTFPQFLSTVMIAVAPVPMAILTASIFSAN